jgi:hypothetical protein
MVRPGGFEALGLLVRSQWSKNTKCLIWGHLQTGNAILPSVSCTQSCTQNRQFNRGRPDGRSPQDPCILIVGISCSCVSAMLPISRCVYGIAVYDILEQAGLEVYLVNARETKNLPGRKSDVQESQWLMKLHTFGLLRNSFRPSQEIRRLRTYWRQRNDLVRSAGRHIQRGCRRR